jgi:hypothetical protein
VTDLAWRDLGRTWLDARGGQLSLDQPALFARLNAQTLYLVVGLSRSWQGEYWPLVVGVHTVPDWRVRSEE